jgi:uncharacterized membrane protein
VTARSPAGEYGRFLLWTVGAAVAAGLLGIAPTRRIWGAGALPAMIAGCAIGVIASAVGALPILMARRSGAAASPVQGLLSTAIRLAVLVVLGLSMGLSGWFEVRPLVVWIAIGYGALLALDVWYAVRGF